MASEFLREGEVRCPAHRDRGPSLHISRAADGRWLLHCFAGCTTEEVLRAAGLSWDDLFPDRLPRPPGHRPYRTPPQSQAAQARADVLDHEDRARAKRAEWLLEWLAADRIRHMRRQADLCRAFATRLGPESEAAWALAARGAELDQRAHLLEAAMDHGE
jgi:putative DNA primase/helicase